ncbi:MAG TPA: hypothetical protein VK702_04910, partial [Candidatus Acidoferrum sp.]|nr:hypothetical protein [Candidatus Acidoferrum sp.]
MKGSQRHGGRGGEPSESGAGFSHAGLFSGMLGLFAQGCTEDARKPGSVQHEEAPMPDATIKSQYDLADLLFPEKQEISEFEVVDVPLEQRRLITDTLDYTVSSIVGLIDSEDLVIPKFQR